MFGKVSTFIAKVRTRIARRTLLQMSQHTDGFTLIEVIAALSILSLSLAVLFGSLSDGFYRQRRAKDLAEATRIARSVLAQVGADIPLQDGNVTGASGLGTRWVVEMRAFGTGADRKIWQATPYHISVSIFENTTSKQPTVALTTLRFADIEQPR